ncbi:MAG TPA: MXAN_6640 family putative metalloprotease [Nocardioides sp.]|nr:MXAN_6640 family putative metalloprotease [Nocardioides sp.]
MTSPSALCAALGAAARTVLGLTLAGTLVATAPVRAAATNPTEPADPAVPAAGEHDDVIARAGRILEGGDGAHARVDATLALRDVFLARPTMDFFDGLLADGLLARPTDGRADRAGDGYRGPAGRRCAEDVCVHYARTGADAPEDGRWVRRTLRVLARTWHHEIGTLGFRPPPTDGRRGGDGRFDVYLADLGDRGLFGYCTPERRAPGERFVASGYCVLDDDFAREQYVARPSASLRVTAAHEFFHAIQFGYDFREDPWLLESTATWVEERVADGADDNRRYLRYGTVHRPGIPLDRFTSDSYAHYGSWAFWELLTHEHGDRVVREVWRRADSRGNAPDEYSVQALDRVLADHGGLRRALTSYAVANLAPRRAYDEGAAWPSARVDERRALVPGRRRTSPLVVRLDHLSAHHAVLRPEDTARGARLRVAVDGPRAATSPAAVLVVRRRDGDWTRERVRLDGRGDGSARVRFGPGVRSVVVTLVNGSTRYRCGDVSDYACGGESRDDRRRFRVSLRLAGGG